MRRSEISFPLRFVAAVGAVAAVWTFAEPQPALLRHATAAAVAWVADLFGLHPVVAPDAHMQFSSGGRSFRYFIDDACTAAVVLATYAAAIVAYPTSGRARLIGIVAGAPILIVLNIVRLVTLAWVGIHAPLAFNAVHLYWWQAFYVVGVGMVWFAWAWFVAGDRRGPLSRRWDPTRLPLALCLLALFAVLGLWGRGAELYLRAIMIPAGAAREILWGRRLPPVEVSEQAVFVTFAGYYASLAAVLALFLVSPGVDLRRRVRGALRVGLPVTVAVQLLASLAATTANVRLGTNASTVDAFVGALIPPLHVGSALVVWHFWLQRARAAEVKRLERSALRRRRANHQRARSRA